MRNIALIAILSCALMQANPFAGYRQLPNIEPKNLLQNPSFDQQGAEAAWALTPECRITAEAGYSQRGLDIRRQDKSVYTIVTQRLNLKPNTRYVYGGRCRAACSDRRAGASFAVEWWDHSPVYRKGMFISGTYHGIPGSFDWKNFQYEFTTGPENPDRHYFLLLFFTKGKTGYANYDDLYVREATGHYCAGLLNPYNRLDTADRTIRFTVGLMGAFHYPGSQQAQLQAWVQVKTPKGQEVLTDLQPVRQGRFQVNGASLAEGEYRVQVTVADIHNRYLLATMEPLRLTVGKPKQPAPKGAVTLDSHGRMLVDGKPFMPVGIYVGGETAFYELNYFADSPFNCLLAYGGLFYRFVRGHKWGKEGLREVMDALHQKNLKVIISMSGFFPKFDGPWTRIAMRSWGKGCEKMSYDDFIAMGVNAVKDHPALLAWYITDELPPPRYKELIARRNLVNALDPYHPTTGVYFQIGELAAYSATQDVPSVDFYPVFAGKNQRQNLIVESMDAAKKVWARADNGEMPFLATLQMFSWGGNDPDKNKQYRMPTEHEMLAMGLMSAIKGAKGFIYYYFHDICYGAGSTTDIKVPRFMKNWKDACGMGRELRNLEPFIMSTAKAPQVTVKNIKGKTLARAFVDERYGRIRVLISSVGPGEAEAEITVPGQRQLRSQFGKTVRNGKNPEVYHFNGTDIDCDILQRWPEIELDKEIGK